jgi:hypothetical protein
LSSSRSRCFDRDSNNAARGWNFRGAYAGEGSNPGWNPAVDFKP